MKSKKNELILAELGDKLIIEKICLEKLQKFLKRKLEYIAKRMKKWKSPASKLDGGLYTIIAIPQLRLIDKRLKEIQEDLEK